MAKSTLTSLEQLKLLAQKINTDFTKVSAFNELSTRVDNLVAVGGEPNKIDSIKVNGTVQEIKDKAVDIKVPNYTVEKSAESGEYAAIY